MQNILPFYSDSLDENGTAIYHTHHRCRIAQLVPAAERVQGTGQYRTECPFCFLLRQFQLNRRVRAQMPTYEAIHATSASQHRPLMERVQAIGNEAYGADSSIAGNLR